MEQILLNLCVNAYHAMTIMRGDNEKPGGELVVSVEKIPSDTQFCMNHAGAKGDFYWDVSITDTGIGMDGKTMAKIFDPFFTTKEKGKGTGLGLAMVYNIVQQHKGFIDVNSEIGTGSRFDVFFPVCGRDEEGVRAVPHEPVAVPRGEGLILVVDDEDVIRTTARAMLEEAGYSVLEASNGMEAISIFRDRHQEIVAVLLDIVMPKKSGEETFLEMKEIQPDVKVLLASGFRLDDRVASIMSRGVKGFLQKPYTLEKLAASIHEVISQK